MKDVERLLVTIEKFPPDFVYEDRYVSAEIRDDILWINGTNSIQDWRHNLDIFPIKHRDHYWHRGFFKHASLVAEALPPVKYLRLFSGHSLGGAAALILSYMFQVPAIVFGAPRPLFCLRTSFLLPPGSLAISRADDLVPRLPNRIFYGYPCPELIIHPKNFHFGEDHTMQNYREVLLNA